MQHPTIRARNTTVFLRLVFALVEELSGSAGRVCRAAVELNNPTPSWSFKGGRSWASQAASGGSNWNCFAELVRTTTLTM